MRRNYAVWLYLALKYWRVQWYSDVHFPSSLHPLPSLSPPQAGSWSDGPSRPAGEASWGGAQQKSADIPPTCRPPSQDIVRLQQTGQGESFLRAPLASSGPLWVCVFQVFSEFSNFHHEVLILLHIFEYYCWLSPTSLLICSTIFYWQLFNIFFSTVLKSTSGGKL